ncbi:hypothetical protein M9435_000945 [Picochlorum sp. BPE23]|nr:hypothetical protein M9435_000945 [Picochlorum sp. BPE23]
MSHVDGNAADAVAEKVSLPEKEKGTEGEPSPKTLQKDGEKKGTLSALWSKNKKKQSMVVIDMTMDDGDTAEEKKDDGDTAEEKNNGGEDFTIQKCHEFDLIRPKDSPMEEKKDDSQVVADETGKDEAVHSDSKKRKRSTLPDAALSDLEEAFKTDPFPSQHVKTALAEKHNVELKRVSNWFDRRRKTARLAGDLPEQKSCSAKGTTTCEAPASEENKGNDSAEKSQEKTQSCVSDAWLMERIGVTRGDLEAEAKQLRERGLLDPLVDINTVKDGMEYSESNLCKLVVGQRCTLSELVSMLHPVFTLNQPQEDALRCSIVDLMVRKTYDPVNKSLEKLQWLEWKNEDSVGNGLWQWEARERDTIPRSSRTHAGALKRRASKVLDRLKCIENVLNLDESKKADKAIESFKKTSSLKQMEEEFEAQKAAEASKEAKERLKEMKNLEKAKMVQQKEEERRMAKEAKERQKREREEAREKAAAEREAERQRKKAAKEEERLQKKREREMEKVKKAEEAGKNKLCKKTGFKDQASLNKTADKFKTFFASATPKSESRRDEVISPSEKSNLSYYEKKFPKPPAGSFTQPQIPAKAISLDERPEHVDLLEQWKCFVSKAGEKAASQREEHKKKYLGLPPSWAQSGDAREKALERMEELKGSGVEPENIKVWRRKFIWFPADSKRPPYYGSHSLTTDQVSARRPFGKEQSLDYDVMSDLDWEDEPEGSSLSKDSLESEAANETADEEDSFFVADGYLSADEGIQLEEQEEEEGEPLNLDEIHLGTDIASKSNRQACRKTLAAFLDKSRRTGRPLILSRESVNANANHGACFHADNTLIAALEMDILLPGAVFEVPADPNEPVEVQGTATVASPEEARKVGEHAATVGGGSHADLLPELSTYIVENAALTKPMLIEGFIRKQEGRKITKKWINEAISLLATRSGSQWVLKDKKEFVPDTSVACTPQCTLKAPQTTEKIGPTNSKQE